MYPKTNTNKDVIIVVFSIGDINSEVAFIPWDVFIYISSSIANTKGTIKKINLQTFCLTIRLPHKVQLYLFPPHF